MAKVLFNSQGILETPTLLLQHKNFETIGNGGITNVSELTYKDNFNDANEVSFKIHKYNNGTKHPLWDDMVDFKIIYIPELKEKFQIAVTVNEEDPNDIYKSITGTSLCESELSQITLRNVQINTETDITNDLYDENFPTILYRNPDDYDSVENQKIWAKSKYDYLKDKTAYPTEESVIAKKKYIISHASLLHRVLEKAPHYSIAHVDSTLENLQIVHEFTFDGTDILSALKNDIAEDYHCLFKFNSEQRTISVYDLYSTCNECGYRGDFIDECPECGNKKVINKYGEDTNVLVNSTNLTKNISLESNQDSLKNCFYITGADDLMNTTVANVNPNGSQYIYYFSDETLADMPDDLQNKLKSYDDLYNEIQKTRKFTLDSTNVSNYNKVVDSITSKFADVSKNDKDKVTFSKIINPLVGYPALTSTWYDAMDLYYFLNDSMLPVIDIDGMGIQDSLNNIKKGITDLGGIAVTKVSSVLSSTVESVLEKLCQVFCSKAYYDISVSTKSLSAYNSTKKTKTWSGTVTITSLTQQDENEQYLTDSIDISCSVLEDNEKYIEQKIKRMTAESDKLKDKQITSFNLSDTNFKKDLTYYSLSELNNMYTEFQACRDIVTNGFTDDTVDVQYNNSALKKKYETFYTNRLKYINAEITTRTNELNSIKKMYNPIDGKGELQVVISEVKKELDLEDYLGSDLWNLFYSYRREDDYDNSNYSSTGLDTTDLIKRATELYKAAQRELYKAGNLQYSISTTMGNLLVLPEFSPIVDKFEVGNFIKVGIDEKVYSLRLLSYQVDYDNLSEIPVEFSTVEKVYSGYSDVESVLQSAKSMSTSYSSVKDQVDKSKGTTKTVSDWTNNGLLGDNISFSNSKEQTVTLTKNGLLARSWDDVYNEFSLKQLKIVNNGLYLTKDGWETIETGVGRFTYTDINGNLVEDYGIIAKTVVGNLIIGKELQIYNEDKSIVIDENGLTINGGYLKITGEEVGSDGKNLAEIIIDLDTAQKLVALAQQAADRAQASADKAQQSADKANQATEKLQTETNEIRELAEKGVDHVLTYFYQSDSATELIGGEWTTNSVTWISGKYVWQKTITYYKDGTDNSKTAKAICISGANGQDGKPGEDGVKGKGVKSITPQYTISDSNVIQPTTGWANTEPEWSEGKYIWTRTLVVYDDNTQEYTTPIVSNGLNSALSISTKANQTANKASSVADTAQASAASAKELADSANNTANKASQDASNAVDTANTANTNASNAMTTANSANETAQDAKTSATNAEEVANMANDTATKADKNASSAITTSNAAQTVANNAKSIADTAKSLTDDLSDNLQTNYSTTKQVEKKIDDKADSITSSITTTISETYETKTDSASKLDTAKGYADTVGSNTLKSANSTAKGYADTAESNANKSTDTKLTSYSTTTEMNSAISQESSKITSSVSEKYATKATVADNLDTAKSYADSVGSYTLTSANTIAKGYADSAETNAKTYTTNQLKSYSMTKDVESKIEQSASAIKQTVSETYVTNTTFETDISKLQGQIDGNIQTWSGTDVPTLKNEPASTWSAEEMPTHIGDIYYDGNNHAYRFRVDDGVYSWQILTDTDVTKALGDSADALSKANATEKKLITDYKTASDTTSEINQTKSSILSTVKDTYATSATVTDLSNNLKTNYSTTTDMNSAIDQKADSITQSVSKTYQTKAQASDDLASAKSYADGVGSDTLTSAKADATTKANNAQKNAIADTTEKLKSYSTTKEMNSAIESKADSITLSVSETYSTKTETSQSLSDAKEYADGVGSSTLSSAKSDATAKANQAKSDAIADTTQKLKSYSTTEQMNAAITTSANSITSEVSKTYSTKTEVSNAIDGIEVGGRNLLVGTNKGTYRWSNSHKGGTYGIEAVIWNNVNAVKMTCETPTSSWKMFTFNGLLDNFGLLEPNGEYILSYDVIGDIQVGFLNLWESSATNSIVKQSKTTIISKDYGLRYIVDIILKDELEKKNQLVYLSNNLTANTSVIIANLKLEKGNKATDWTPAPEDVDSNISTAKSEAISSANASTDQKLKSYSTTEQVNSKISQTEQSITSTVSKTYSTKDELSGVETIATTAQTKAQQSLDQFLWLVKSGSSSSFLTLTDSAITAITKQFTISSPDGKATIIEGGKLKTDAIKSNNYVIGNNGTFSSFGTFIDLENGEIHTPGFYLDNVGNAFYQGTVNATAGYFGDTSNNWYIGSADFNKVRNKDDAIVSGINYSALLAEGNAAITAGSWYLMSQEGSLGIQSGWTTINGGNYVFDKDTQKYYDMGMVEPIFGSKNEWDNKFLYIRRVTDPSSSQSTWEYLFKVDKDGTIYENGTKLSDKYALKTAVGSTYLPITGGTVTGNLTVNGTLTATASKAKQLTNAITINGQSWNGSANLTIGTLGVSYGGTGKSSWTTNGIVYASGSGTLSQLSLGTSGYVLASGGTSAPSWVNPSTLNVATATKATKDGNGNTISNTYLRKDFDSVAQNVTFGGSVDISDLTTETLLVSGVARFSNGLIGNLKGTASNAPWSGITGKPDTFTPSAHKHVMSDISDWDTYVYSAQASRTKNTVLAAPNGSDGKATFRSLVEADIPTLSKGKVGLGNVDNTADSAKNVLSATKLTTARKIGNASFDGSADITLAQIGAASSGHTHNYASKVTLAGTDYSCVSNAIAITKANLQTAIGSTGLGLMTEAERSKLNSIKVSSGGTIDFSGVTASGALTATVSDTKTVAITHNTSGITAGTYKSVTVDTYGHVTTGSNPTTLGEYGITDALKSDTKYALSDSVGGNALHALHLGSNSSTNSADQGGLYWFNLDGKEGAVADTNDTPTSAWWYIQRNRHTNQTNNYYTDVAIPFNNTGIYYKTVNAGVVRYNRWIQVFDDLNYTNYVPKKDGTGASGTWGISITGSSASATNDSDGNKISSTYLKLSGGTLTGTLHVKPTAKGSYDEGIRMHPYNNWCTITLCGTDNTGDTGTSAKTWSIHNKDGLFYITKNGSSSSSSAILSCIGDNIWRMNGNVVLHSGNYNDYSPSKTGSGASGTWNINISGNAAKDGSGNVITSKYVTVDTTQTISGVKTFSKEITISNETASTSKTTGALKVKGGIASEGQISSDKVMIGDHVRLEYDSSLSCLNFVFA